MQSSHLSSKYPCWESVLGPGLLSCPHITLCPSQLPSFLSHLIMGERKAGAKTQVSVLNLHMGDIKDTWP